MRTESECTGDFVHTDAHAWLLFVRNFIVVCALHVGQLMETIVDAQNLFVIHNNIWLSSEQKFSIITLTIISPR